MSSSSFLVAVKNFVLIPQHTSPDSALEETDALYDVVSDVRTRWNTNVNPLSSFVPNSAFSGSKCRRIKIVSLVDCLMEVSEV